MILQVVQSQVVLDPCVSIPTQRVSAEFVYARFAYTVINLLQSSCFDEFPIPDEVLLAEKMRLSEKKRKTAARKRKEPKLSASDEGGDISAYFVFYPIYWLSRV